MRRFYRLFLTAPVSVLFFAATAAQAAMPQAEYACQVLTVAGDQGVVMVQADLRESAEKAAKGGLALTVDKAGEPVSTVVQCIRLPDERFRDTYFQQVFQKIPL